MGCSKNVYIEMAVPDDKMYSYICSAFDKAIDFLAVSDLDPKRLVKIKIVKGAIDSNGYIAFDSYNRQNDLIQLMSYIVI